MSGSREYRLVTAFKKNTIHCKAVYYKLYVRESVTKSDNVYHTLSDSWMFCTPFSTSEVSEVKNIYKEDSSSVILEESEDLIKNNLKRY